MVVPLRLRGSHRRDYSDKHVANTLTRVSQREHCISRDTHLPVDRNGRFRSSTDSVAVTVNPAGDSVTLLRRHGLYKRQKGSFGKLDVTVRPMTSSHTGTL